MSINSPAGRSATIDIAKGIAIFLVVIGHNLYVRNSLHGMYESIYLFHMPLFLALSGVNYSKISFSSYIQKRSKTILRPYFVPLLVLFVFSSLKIHSIDYQQLGGIFYGTGHTIKWTPLWFLTFLFVVLAVFGLIFNVLQSSVERFSNVKTKIAISAAIFLLIFFIGYEIIRIDLLGLKNLVDALGRPIGLPWGVDLLPVGLSFVWLGFSFKRQLLTGLEGHRLIFRLFVCVVVVLLAANAGSSLDFNYRRIDGVIGVLLASVAGIFFVFYLSLLIEKNARYLGLLFQYCGERSIVILVFHNQIQRRIYDALESHVNGILVFSISLFLSIAIVLLFDGFLRRSSGYRWVFYGGRIHA